MKKSNVIALAVIALSGALAGVVALVAVAYSAGRSAVAPPAPAPAAAAPLPTPPPVPVAPAPVSPVVAAMMEAGIEGQRLAALEPSARDAELALWADLGALSYGTLMRNPDERIGRRVAWRGRVEEIHDTDGGGSQLRIALRGYGQDVLWVETLGVRAPESVEAGSRVRFYGIITGTFTYTSQAGWNITLPAVAAVAVVPESRR